MAENEFDRVECFKDAGGLSAEGALKGWVQRMAKENACFQMAHITTMVRNDLATIVVLYRTGTSHYSELNQEN